LPGPSPIAEHWSRGLADDDYSDADADDYDYEYGGGFDEFADPDSDVEAPAPEHVADVLEVVQDMLVDVIGPEYLIDLSIGLETSFDVDLELESLEFVALAERLLQHYGGQVDFVAWLATMELDEIIALAVGDLVAFIVASTS
jgi:acyl carrier protein